MASRIGHLACCSWGVELSVSAWGRMSLLRAQASCFFHLASMVGEHKACSIDVSRAKFWIAAVYTVLFRSVILVPHLLSVRAGKFALQPHEVDDYAMQAPALRRSALQLGCSQGSGSACTLSLCSVQEVLLFPTHSHPPACPPLPPVSYIRHRGIHRAHALPKCKYSVVQGTLLETCSFSQTRPPRR